MMGIIPEVLTLRGMLEVAPPTILLPAIFLAYCTGILLSPPLRKTTSTIIAITIAMIIAAERTAVAGALPITNCSKRELRS